MNSICCRKVFLQLQNCQLRYLCLCPNAKCLNDEWTCCKMLNIYNDIGKTDPKRDEGNLLQDCWLTHFITKSHKYLPLGLSVLCLHLNIDFMWSKLCAICLPSGATYLLRISQQTCLNFYLTWKCTINSHEASQICAGGQQVGLPTYSWDNVRILHLEREKVVFWFFVVQGMHLSSASGWNLEWCIIYEVTDKSIVFYKLTSLIL